MEAELELELGLEPCFFRCLCCLLDDLLPLSCRASVDLRRAWPSRSSVGIAWLSA